MRGVERGSDPEGAITRVIAGVLGLPSVEASDNLFDLGLTSMRAVRICTRLRRDLGLDPAPERLLGSETVSDFMATIVGARNG